MPRAPSGLPEFLEWPTERVAEWIGNRPEPLVVGWPFNGTRRWFLGYARDHPEKNDYPSTLARRLAEHHRMLLDHGVAAVITPSFGELNLRRGEEYVRHALRGLVSMASDEAYLELFRRGARVRFYGDYRETLSGPEFGPMVEACDEIMASTADGDGPLILLGLFADNADEAIARLAVDLFRKHGKVPDRAALIENYYGVPVPDLGFYVGFEQPQIFDVPLVKTGWEDLYYTLNPTPDVDERQLRTILYDHLVARGSTDVEYDKLPLEGQLRIVEQSRRRGTVGLGRVDPLTGVWRPVLPPADDPVS
jgi:adenosine tuberculosinyltransferase